MVSHRLGLVARLALADMRGDAKLFACIALTVAAVMAPLLLLLGLKTGVVEFLVGGLRADPQVRELVLRGHNPRPPAWFDTMRARADVAFVAPRLRQLSQPVDVGRPAEPTRGSNGDFVVSAPGDPLLGALSDGIAADGVVVSARMAQAGGFAVGDRLLVWAIRRAATGNQRIDVPARVVGIAPPTVTQNAVVFGPLAMAVALERFQEQPAGAAGLPADYVFASFRLYARDITDVAGLERDLLAQGLEVRTEAGRIAWTLSIDRNLTLLFAVLTGCGAAGVAVTLAVSLWANVARKRRALSLLRLLGLSGRALTAFPVVQAALVALAGGILAAAVALAVAAAINFAYGDAYLTGSRLCRITLSHILGAVAGAVLLSVLASLVALRPVLRIAPAEGMRET